MRVLVTISTVDDSAGYDCLQPEQLIRKFVVEYDPTLAPQVDNVPMLALRVQEQIEKEFYTEHTNSYAIEPDDSAPC